MKAGKKAPKRKPARGRAGVEAGRAEAELAEKAFAARLKFHRWKEVAFALYENQYRRLVKPEGDEDEVGDGVLTREQSRFLTEKELWAAKVELEELQEVLDSMIAEVEAL